MTANSDAPLIEAQTLYRRFGVVTAVNGLSLAVDRGEIVGFLGPNGAGKTTTLRMLAGYLPPDAGRVSLGGIDMWTRPQEARRHLGYLPEGAPLYREMTPLSLLRFIAGIRGLSRRLWRQRRDFVIDALMLEPVLYSRIETLSKGYRRRVAFAVALLSDPEILILDEPTDGLDPNQKRDVRVLLRSLASEKAILLSTHLLEEVDTVCDRALIVDRGRIVAAGSSADFRARAPAAGTLVLHVPPADAERAEKCLAAASITATPDPQNRGWITLSPKRQPGGRDGVGPADSDLLRNTASANLVRAGIRVLSLATISNPLDAVFQAVTRPGQRQEIGR